MLRGAVVPADPTMLAGTNSAVYFDFQFTVKAFIGGPCLQGVQEKLKAKCILCIRDAWMNLDDTL